MTDQDGLVQLLKSKQIQDVLGMSDEADLRRPQVFTFTHARERWCENDVSKFAQLISDFAPAPAAMPAAMD
jgi:hypothetical protein